MVVPQDQPIKQPPSIYVPYKEISGFVAGDNRKSDMVIYCRVPEGRVLHKAAIYPGRDGTRSVNPLVRTQMDKLLKMKIEANTRPTVYTQK